MLRLFRYLKPYTSLLLAVAFFLSAQAVFELYLPTLMSNVVNNGMMKGDIPFIWKYGGWMLVVAMIISICSISSSFLSALIGVGFGRDVRNLLFSRIQNYSLYEFDKIGTASLITRTTNDVTQVQTLIIMGLRFIIFTPIMCLGGIIMAYLKDARLTLILAAVLPLMALFIIGTARLVVPLFKAMQIKLDKVNLVLRENLTGIRVIRAFNRIGSETRRFETANRDLADNAIRVNKIMALMPPAMMLFMNLTTIAIIWFGGFRINDGHMLVGDMMAFMQYAMVIMFSIIMVTIMFVMLPRAEASAIRINEVLDILPGISDPVQAKIAEEATGCVEFRNVSFSYPGAEEAAISNVSFSARPGEVTAIIGGTGSGKSTLVNLIPRFYDLDSGSIKVDGIDIREMTQKELRRKIGFVSQTPVIFSGTVDDNIRFGNPDASREDVIRAAQTAQALEFIDVLPEGINSQVAQGGTNLSGGQKQRISIARALVRKPEIYIFDDSFSALDYRTDALLRAALREETRHSTVIIVAQRVGTVMNADQIIVMDEGRVVGIGSHEDLVARNQVYREIVLSQLAEEEIA